MKKILLIIIVLFAINFTEAQLYFGGKTGINLSTMSGKNNKNDKSEHKYISGFQIGGVINYHISDIFSLQTELLFIQKGYVIKYTNSILEEEHVKYNTIEIPILAQVGFGKKIRFYGNIGPYFNMKLSGKRETILYNGTIINDNINLYKDGLNNDMRRLLDIGLYIGGGISKPLGYGIISFDIRFGFGFINNFNDDYYKEQDGYEPFLYRNLSIAVTYVFGKNSIQSGNEHKSKKKRVPIDL